MHIKQHSNYDPILIKIYTDICVDRIIYTYYIVQCICNKYDCD